MNEANLRAVQDLLRAEPEHFDMSKVFGCRDDMSPQEKEDWRRRTQFLPASEALRDCGTAACIVGYAGALDDPKASHIIAMPLAMSWLGLTEAQAKALFTPPGWETHRFSPEHGIEAIETLIATGVPSWPDPATLPRRDEPQ